MLNIQRHASPNIQRIVLFSFVIDLIIVLFSDHFTIHDHDFTGIDDYEAAGGRPKLLH